MEQPKKYQNISSVPSYKELPFCIVTFTANPSRILDSIESQNYSNYKFLYFAEEEKINRKDKVIFVNSAEKELMANDAAILGKCGLNNVILVADSPLKSNSLSRLNKIYQENNIWLTYSMESDIDIGVSSFFGYLLRNVRKTNKYGTVINEFLKDRNFVVLALL